MRKGRVASFARARLALAMRAVGLPPVLAWGYAVVRLAGPGTIVRSVGQIRGKEEMEVRVADGTFGAEALPRDEKRQAPGNRRGSAP